MGNYYFSITGRLIRRVGQFSPGVKVASRFLLLLQLPFILIGSMTACNDIFEKNISADSLQLIMPLADDTLLVNNVHFKWEKMKGARFYNLQIVQPSFNNIASFVLDSNIDGEEFFFVLDPGAYQFQIRGENSAYQSLYTGPYNLYIDSVSDLTAQVVPLLAPADLIYSNDANFTFSWQAVYAAETYEFQLHAGADFGLSGTTLHAAPEIYGTSYSPPTGLFSTEGAYSWGVKALNTTSSTGFSDRTIYIDLTLPNSPSSVSPAHGASFADTVMLKWSTGADAGTIQSPVSRLVEISADTLFGTVLQNYSVTVDSVEHVFSSPGTYWWRVYTEDAAGNVSTNYSAHRKIIIP